MLSSTSDGSCAAAASVVSWSAACACTAPWLTRCPDAIICLQGHLLPPFPDGPARGNQTAPGAAAGADEDASKQQQKQQQQQQQQQQQGTCSWEEAPPRRNPQQQGEQPSNATMLGNGSSSSISGNATSSDNVAKVVKATLEQQIEQHVEAKCRHLCSQSEAASSALSQATATLRAAMPLLPLPASAPALLRARRCAACKEVTRTLRRAQLGKSFLAAMSGKSRVQAAAEAVRLSNRPAYSASGQLVNRQFLCVIEVCAVSWCAGAMLLLWGATPRLWGATLLLVVAAAAGLASCLAAAPAAHNRAQPAHAATHAPLHRRCGAGAWAAASSRRSPPARSASTGSMPCHPTSCLSRFALRCALPCCAALRCAALGGALRRMLHLCICRCACMLAFSGRRRAWSRSQLDPPAPGAAAADRRPAQAAWSGQRCRRSR